MGQPCRLIIEIKVQYQSIAHNIYYNRYIYTSFVVDKTTAYLLMLMEGQGAYQNDLDSCKVHLLVVSFIMISILVGDLCLLGLTFSAW